MSTKKPAPKWELDAKETIKTQIRRITKPLQDQLERDVSEADTRTLIMDFLHLALGYDKFEDLSAEQRIRGEFADYIIKIDKQDKAVIEVKRTAQDLNSRHLRQAETYAVNKGIFWVFLTNGRVWQAYRTWATTGQPVKTDLVVEVDILGDETPSKKADKLFHFSKPALRKETLAELYRKKSATAPKSLADILMSDTVIQAIRREIRKETGYNPAPLEIIDSLKTGVITTDLEK